MTEVPVTEVEDAPLESNKEVEEEKLFDYLKHCNRKKLTVAKGAKKVKTWFTLTANTAPKPFKALLTVHF